MLCPVAFAPPTSPSDQERRLKYFGLDPEDESLLEAGREVIQTRADDLIEDFYRHLLSFNEIQHFLACPETLRRQKSLFRQYLCRLGEGLQSADYISNRVRIGQVHERTGVAIRQYLGACAHLQERITRAVMESRGADGTTASIVAAINKVFMLDSSLAVEAYHQNALQRTEQLMQQLEKEKEAICRMAQTDHLTGLLNRRTMLDALEVECHRCHRYGNSLCVLMLDIDNFKSINDTHGHDVGDAVLQTVSGVLGRCVRRTDKCGRWGGEEFVVVLIESNLSTAELMGERIRLAVRAEETVSPRVNLSVSASIGGAEWNDALGAADLLKLADEALYAAKASGKNCVRMAASAR